MWRVVFIFVSFFLPILLLTSLVSAQGGKTPDATVAQNYFKSPGKIKSIDKNKNKIFDDLEDLIGPAASDARFDVIVLLNESLDLLPTLKGRHGDFSETNTYPSINGFATNLSKGQIIAFADDNDIKQVEHDALAYPHLDTSQQWFGTAKARTDFGVDGDAAGNGLKTYSTGDIVIAIIDSGIDDAHVDLNGGKVIAWNDFTNRNWSTPDDEVSGCSGHGSHVSSIAAGEGDGNPAFKGVAPGAALIGLKVLRRQGGGCSGQRSWINSAIQWLINNKSTYGIDVANMSLGFDGCFDGTDSTSVLVNQAVAAGIVMTVSAGNEGPGTCTVGSPGVATGALTVGAMADVFPTNSSASFSCGPAPYVGFNLSCFSSRGLTDDSRLKPDIAAPGMFINAVAADSGNGYKELSGTSMASPFMAGVVGLMLHANSGLTPSQIKATIESTAFDWGVAGKDIEYGSGRLQAYEAVKSAGGFSGTNVSTPAHLHLTGTVSSGSFHEQTIEVSDTSLPLAATMIITSGSGTSPDLDLEIRDPSGTPLFSCSGGPTSTAPCPCTSDSSGICKSRSITRQETVGFQPTSPGTYRLRAVSYSGGGDYFMDVSVGQAAVAISVADGAVEFGVLALGTSADTGGDVQTVSIDIGPADLDVRSSNFSDGTNTWFLGASSGADQVKWEFSPNGSSWSIFGVANTLYPLATNVPQGNTQDVYFQLTMPTSTSSNNEHSTTVTIVATAP